VFPYLRNNGEKSRSGRTQHQFLRTDGTDLRSADERSRSVPGGLRDVSVVRHQQLVRWTLADVLDRGSTSCFRVVVVNASADERRSVRSACRLRSHGGLHERKPRQQEPHPRLPHGARFGRRRRDMHERVVVWPLCTRGGVAIVVLLRDGGRGRSLPVGWPLVHRTDPALQRTLVGRGPNRAIAQ